MDLNELFSLHQVALVRATAGPMAGQAAHRARAVDYVGRIARLRHDAGARFATPELPR